MSQSVAYFESIISNRIVEVMAGMTPDTLFEPGRYILSLGGKRLRPLLTLLVADMFDKRAEEVVDAALAIEVFHNFSLLHDDLMDNADMRRGSQTVHKKWNANTAILSGDAMVIESYRYISKVPTDYLPSVLDSFTTMAMYICRGQQYDMDFETRNDVSEREYLEMIKLKTSVMIGCAMEIGAVLADAKPADVRALRDFGINMGLAFQLKDDLLDVYGDPEVFGKKLGGDILSNKKTYLLIKALEGADNNQKEVLDYWLSAEDYDAQDKIDAVRNIYDELDLKSVSERKIKYFYEESVKYLDAVSVEESKKEVLREFSLKLLNREK